MDMLKFRADLKDHPGILHAELHNWVNEGKPAVVSYEHANGDCMRFHVFMNEVPTGPYTGRWRYVLHTTVCDKRGTLLKSDYNVSDWCDSLHATHDRAYGLWQALAQQVSYL